MYTSICWYLRVLPVFHRPDVVGIKLIILGILSKFNLSTRGLNSLTYPVYLKTNLLSLLFLLILKIRNPLSFVISIINLFVVLFLTIRN